MKTKLVMTFGTFDLFHEGHKHYLKESKALGDKLIVVIARDKTVNEVKNFYPNQNEQIRLQNVQNSHIPDLVILGSLDDKFQVLKEHKPDIIALGYDQKAFTENLNNFIIDNDLSTKIVRITSFHPDKYKSSIIKKSL